MPAGSDAAPSRMADSRSVPRPAAPAVWRSCQPFLVFSSSAVKRVLRAKGMIRVQCRPCPRSTSLAIADSRARSSGDTLAEVSASTATATFVWYTTIRGPLSASTMQTNAAALSPSARRRADSRHSHAAQPSGSNRASNTQG